MTLTFNLMRAMVMTYLRAKVLGQQSIGSEDRVETNRRTDRRTDGPSVRLSVRNGGDRITPRANAVGKNRMQLD